MSATSTHTNPELSGSSGAPRVSSTMKLSVIVPIYNERATLRDVVAKVLSVPLEIELICVDDGSRDGSREILSELEKHTRSSGFSFSRRTWAKGRPCAAEFRRRPAIM